MMDNIISDLNVNYDSSNPNDYIDILNKISLSTEECVDNLGVYADITSVELRSEMIADVCDEFIQTSVVDNEVPGPTGSINNSYMSPEELTYDELVENNTIEKELKEKKDGRWSIKTHIMTPVVLGGTIVEHNCDTREKCKECMGSGRCRHCGGDGHNECSKCHGEGSEICRKCGGTGYCRRCNGSGEVTCTECGGKGWRNKSDGTTEKCWKCSGKGMIECPDCGSRYRGKCRECNGRGVVTCSKCYGRGKISCSDCHGSGVCDNCNGNGYLVCSRCNGTGVYLTFNRVVPILYTSETTMYSSEQISALLDKATKEIVFDGTIHKESKYGITEYDKIDEVGSLLNMAFLHLPDAADYYVDQYTALAKERQQNGALYKLNSRIFMVPAAKVSYRVNNKDYSVLLLGKNGVISTESFPTIINEVKDNMIQRFLKSVTRRKRLVSYIKLAAYICQSDGVDVSESRLLNAFINKLKYNKQKEETFKSELSKYNSKYLPYVELRKEIKSLFVSKKMLSFAWQCMSVDKKHSEQEKVLFDTLCQELKVTNPQELEKLERFAERFARLDNEMIVEEYLK